MITLHITHNNTVKRVTSFLPLIFILNSLIFRQSFHCHGTEISETFIDTQNCITTGTLHNLHYLHVNNGRIYQHIVNVLESLLKSPNTWSLSKSQQFSNVFVPVFVITKYFTVKLLQYI